MVRSTVLGAPFVTEGPGKSGDRLAAADWLRIAFHEAGQFKALSWDGTTPAAGDDGSFWYEANKQTAPAIFAANFEMWEQTLDSRKKVYRTVNRCGARVADACRYPCEEVCGYVDESLFPGFKPDGSASSCDGSKPGPEELERDCRRRTSRSRAPRRAPPRRRAAAPPPRVALCRRQPWGDPRARRALLSPRARRARAPGAGDACSTAIARARASARVSTRTATRTTTPRT